MGLENIWYARFPWHLSMQVQWDLKLAWVSRAMGQERGVRLPFSYAYRLSTGRDLPVYSFPSVLRMALAVLCVPWTSSWINNEENYLLLATLYFVLPNLTRWCWLINDKFRNRVSQLDLCCEKWGAGFVAFFKIAAVLISTQIRHLAVEGLRKIPRCSKNAGLGIYTFALRMPLCTRDDLTHQFM